jgi:hypothetical protein
VAQPDLLAAQRRAGGLQLDDGAALRREQFGHPAEQGGRVAADPDVPVREQHRGPAAGARHTVEHVAQHDQRARGPGQVHGVRRDVDAQGGDAALGQGDGQPARSRTDIERGALAPVQDRFVAGAFAQPAVHRQRLAAAVGVLDLRPGPAGQRVLVEFPDHADSSHETLDDREAGAARGPLSLDRSIAPPVPAAQKHPSVLTPAGSRGAGSVPNRADLTESSLCLRSRDAFVLFTGITGCLRLNVEA